MFGVPGWFPIHVCVWITASADDAWSARSAASAISAATTHRGKSRGVPVVGACIGGYLRSTGNVGAGSRKRRERRFES
jgi:hypothetical protein